MGKSNSVFVLTAGCYSDYHLVGLFSTKENAEKAIKRYSIEDANDIFESTVDEMVKYFDLKYQNYSFIMHRDGSVEKMGVSKLSDYHNTTNIFFLNRSKAPAYYGKNIDILSCNVVAKTEKQAIKIANEIRTRRIAEGIDKW